MTMTMTMTMTMLVALREDEMSDPNISPPFDEKGDSDVFPPPPPMHAGKDEDDLLHFDSADDDE